MIEKTAEAATGDQSMGPGIRRTPLWFPSAHRTLWGWLHQLPDESYARGEAVVICNPVGHELVHAYRSIRHLADGLAKSGFSVLRFDYSGTGDSTGDQLDDGIVDCWLADVRSAVQLMRERFGVHPVHLLGVRNGALFAASSLAVANIDGSLILWDPIASGKRFVRELKANSRLAYFKSSPDLLEAAGFPYSIEMQERLASMDINASVDGSDLPILLVTREEQPDKRLAQALGDRCPGFVQVATPGFEAMLIEPHKTQVPFDGIAAVADWLGGRPRGTNVSQPVTVTNEPSQLLSAEEGDIVETAVEIGVSSMFGIYCRPAAGSATSRPVVLFGNAGSNYRIGPNRLYVTLSRKLARAGYASIRYDLPNIGDGLKYPHAEENRPYPMKAVEYITEVIDFARSEMQHDAAILTGFCSGATQAFAAALAQHPTSALVEIMVVNPKVFYKSQLGRDEENLVMRRANYYQRAIRDKERWRRLVRGDIDFRQHGAYVVRRSRQFLRSTVRRLLSAIGATSGTRLGDDLKRFVKTGRRLSFFFSSRDPGLTLLVKTSGGVGKRLIDEGDISVTVIDDADHTLTAKRCRDDFVRKFIAQVSRTYPKSG